MGLLQFEGSSWAEHQAWQSNKVAYARLSKLLDDIEERCRERSRRAHGVRSTTHLSARRITAAYAVVYAIDGDKARIVSCRFPWLA